MHWHTCVLWRIASPRRLGLPVLPTPGTLCYACDVWIATTADRSYYSAHVGTLTCASLAVRVWPWRKKLLYNDVDLKLAETVNDLWSHHTVLLVRSRSCALQHRLGIRLRLVANPQATHVEIERRGRGRDRKNTQVPNIKKCMVVYSRAKQPRFRFPTVFLTRM